MYAIIQAGGQQFKVEEGTTIELNSFEATTAVGETITIEDVLMVNKDGNLVVGTPVVAGATVTLEVVEHFRGPKLIVFKFKRRHRYHRKNGHRQELTRAVVKSINA